MAMKEAVRIARSDDRAKVAKRPLWAMKEAVRIARSDDRAKVAKRPLWPSPTSVRNRDDPGATVSRRFDQSDELAATRK
jgi:hypothetical protein